MSVPYFFEPSLPHLPGHFTLSAETAKHCVQVLRMKEGAMIVLTDGKGNRYDATILSASKKETVVMLANKTMVPANNPVTSIAISFVKNPSRMEWFLEKATEIGISQFFPLLSERTEKNHFKTERWENIIVSAMLQSKQVWKPVLHQPIHFAELIQQPFDGGKLIAHCEKGDKIQLANLPQQNQQLILIGPEGDFSPAEIACALKQGFTPVSLGNTRLRTETAGLAAAVLLQTK
ncbi:MAG: 16S rRNA (uracil(1498)-N(3))-methyltransferase [Sphingobacteriia bacterium]|nr:MAG: 16S rRNA (uracil(1498)-N(3))-methyltransferase [Sphingobacteriia bacterium]